MHLAAEQEAQSPFCWLCERPQRLVVPQKMPGQRRIWRLPSKQMVAGIERALKVQSFVARCNMQSIVLAALPSLPQDVSNMDVYPPGCRAHAMAELSPTC